MTVSASATKLILLGTKGGPRVTGGEQTREMTTSRGVALPNIG